MILSFVALLLSPSFAQSGISSPNGVVRSLLSRVSSDSQLPRTINLGQAGRLQVISPMTAWIFAEMTAISQSSMIAPSMNQPQAAVTGQIALAVGVPFGNFEWLNTHCRFYTPAVVALQGDADADGTRITGRIRSASARIAPGMLCGSRRRGVIFAPVVGFTSTRGLLSRDSNVSIAEISYPQIGGRIVAWMNRLRASGENASQAWLDILATNNIGSDDTEIAVGAGYAPNDRAAIGLQGYLQQMRLESGEFIGAQRIQINASLTFD